jgi:DNA-binding NarL/FixJ family response regulator
MTVTDTLDVHRATRVIVVDDHAAVRLGLQRVLTREAGFEALAAVRDEHGLRAVIGDVEPDVVVVDYGLTCGDGLLVCHRLKQRRPAPGVVVYSAYAGPALTVPAVIAQADAVVHKAEPVEALLDAIRRVATGERLLRTPSPELMHAATARLAPEDMPVVAMLIDGARDDEIAETLQLDGGEPDAIAMEHRVRRIIGRLRLRSRELRLK